MKKIKPILRMYANGIITLNEMTAIINVMGEMRSYTSIHGVKTVIAMIDEKLVTVSI